MALVNLREPEDVGQALLPWLAARMPDADEITLPAPRLPDVGGSSDTFFLSPTVRRNGVAERHDWVLRIEPTGYQVYKDAGVETQFRIQRILEPSGEVPVPRSFWFEPRDAILGAPFFLMECVAGQVPPMLIYSEGPWIEASAASRAALWRSSVEHLARIHCVDPAPFGFLARTEAGATILERELAYWDGYRRWSEIEPRAAHTDARACLGRNIPPASPLSLCWGDARPCNMIFRDDTCRAVIDWETASLGCAELDLGWWLFFDWYVSDGFGIPRPPGIGDREATIALWEENAGRSAEALHWHELFATLRFGMIVDRSLLLARRLGQEVTQYGTVGDIISRRLLDLIDGGEGLR